MRVGYLPYLFLIGTSLLPQLANSADRALLVGISEYIDPSIPSLPGTKNDVIAMQQLLENKFGVDRLDIHVLRDKQATYAGILKSFDDWLVNGTKAGDRLFFYYSGHGSFVRDLDGDESKQAGGDGQDEALVPYDVTCEPIKGCKNMLLDDELGERFVKLKDRYVFSMFDSCNSGTVTRTMIGSSDKSVSKLYIPNMDDSDLSESTRSISLEGSDDIVYSVTPQASTKSLAEAHRKEGGFIETLGQHVSLFAVHPMQLALEVNGPDYKRRGLFTSTILEALENQDSDYNKDGAVSFGELMRFSNEKTKVYCSALVARCGVGGVDPLFEVPPELMASSVLDYGKETVDVHQESTATTNQVTSILTQGNDANIQIVIEPEGELVAGEPIQIEVSSDREGLIYLFDQGSDGRIIALYPDPSSPIVLSDGKPLGWVSAAGSVVFPNSQTGLSYRVDGPAGKGQIIAVLAEHYQSMGAMMKSFEAVASAKNNEEEVKYLSELRIALDTLITNSQDSSLQVSPDWSMATSSYQVVNQ